MITKRADVNDITLKQELDAISKKLILKDIDEALYFPKYFQIETTNLCNSRCPFCPNSKIDKSVPYMSDSLFKKILKELSEYSNWIHSVYPQRFGEPLLDKKIAYRIKALKGINIKFISMATNAALLNEEKAREILNAGIDELMISIDSVEKSKYVEQRVGLDFDTVIKNIRNFFKLRDEIRPDTVIRVRGIYFANSTTEQEFEKWNSFWHYLKKKHDRIYMKKEQYWGKQEKWNNSENESSWLYNPCLSLWTTFHITTSGQVPLCCLDYDAKVNLGNVKKSTIKEIWNSNLMNKMRKLHKEGKRNQIAFCKRCNTFESDAIIERK